MGVAMMSCFAGTCIILKPQTCFVSEDTDWRETERLSAAFVSDHLGKNGWNAVLAYNGKL